MNIKNTVFNGIMDIKDKFDILIFDVYGVIWSGKEIYKNIPEIMGNLKKEGKIIYILSNGTQLSSEWEKSYAKKGLVKGIHYDMAITSGEVARDFLLNSALKFKNNTKPVNYYTVGMKNKSLFENTIYKEVDDVKKADFFYFGIPQLTEERTKTINKDKFFLSKIKEDGSKKYSITTSDIFKEDLKKVLELGLSGFNANPDMGSIKDDIENKTTKYGLCQGALVKDYKDMGGEVVEIGKPHKIVFDYIFDKLKENNITVNKNRIAIIGDTVITDIRGGNKAGIKTILTVGTGVTGNKVQKNGKVDFKALNEIYADEDGYANYLIHSVAGKQTEISLLLTLTKQK
ncbi:HAD hydrolase-like protein [bacterium]|nr:HAD hydrolase-like protein [bacterium]